MQNELSYLVSRVDHLERTNRRWRRFTLVGVLAALVGLASGFGRPTDDELRAERFVLVSAEGEELGSLGVDSTGAPQFLLRKDKSSALLTLNGPGLNLRGTDGKSGAFLGVDTKGISRLEVKSKSFVDGVRLTAHPDGSSGVYLLNRDGRERSSLEVLAGGTSQFTARDSKGNIRVMLGLDTSEIPAMVFLDEIGRRRIGMLIQPGPEGIPLIAMEDLAGSTRTELTMTPDGSPRFKLTGDKGQTLFQAP